MLKRIPPPTRSPALFPDSGETPVRRADPLDAVADRAISGDRQALETLLLELGAPMLRTVRKVLGTHHPSVDDVAQEAALGFVHGLPTFRKECTLAHFAVRVALRSALKARRHEQARSRVGDFSSDESEHRSDELSPFQIALDQERRRIVRQFLDQLSEPIAEAVALHFMLGYAVQEIAALQEISTHTVWSRLKLGKRSIQTALATDARFVGLLQKGEQ
jgi:RNA polymerase sigma factor (sigma-70 family)